MVVFPHPSSRTCLQGKHNEALPLLEKAIRIRVKKLGETHQDTVDTQAFMERVREQVGANTGGYAP